MTRTAPEELRALLRRGRLTGSAAAAIAGVNPRTIRRWIGGESEIPYSAWARIHAHVEQEEMIAEAEAAGAAWEAAVDAASPPDVEASLKLLRGVETQQYTRVCALEDELMEAQAEHRATTRKINKLLAERR